MSKIKSEGLELRVCHIPQLGHDATFYVPATSIEEAAKAIEMLAAYDAFQLQNKIKPDYSSTSWVEVKGPDGEWTNWEYEDDDTWYEDMNEYLKSEEFVNSETGKNVKKYSETVFSQIDWEKIDSMTR